MTPAQKRDHNLLVNAINNERRYTRVFLSDMLEEQYINRSEYTCLVQKYEAQFPLKELK